VQSEPGDQIPRMHEERRRRWFAAANSGLVEPVPVAAARGSPTTSSHCGRCWSDQPSRFHFSNTLSRRSVRGGPRSEPHHDQHQQRRAETASLMAILDLLRISPRGNTSMPYRRAPITEAVIELRFAQTIDSETVQKAVRRVRSEYTFEEPETGISAQLDMAAQKAEFQHAWSGVKLSSLERTDLSMFRTNGFACSRLAPYLGWEAFQPRATRDWDALRATTGPLALARIGVRYINRIDVPVATDVGIRVEDYLNVGPRSPEVDEPITGFTVQIVRPLGVDDCGVILNSATVESPLIGFASFLLDLDVYREKDLPRRDDELWALIERMRHHKNRVFESCITDQARTIFDQ
jgi:uncharacterized protein (TIGR04255 family)